MPTSSADTPSSQPFGSILSKWKEKGATTNKNDFLKLGDRNKIRNNKLLDDCVESSPASSRPGMKKKGASQESMEMEPEIIRPPSLTRGSSDTKSGEHHTHRVAATDHGSISSFAYWKEKSSRGDLGNAASSSEGFDSVEHDASSRFDASVNCDEGESTYSMDTVASPTPSEVRRKFNMQAQSQGSAPTLFANKGLSRKTAATSSPVTNTSPTSVTARTVKPKVPTEVTQAQSTHNGIAPSTWRTPTVPFDNSPQAKEKPPVLMRCDDEEEDPPLETVAKASVPSKKPIVSSKRRESVRYSRTVSIRSAYQRPPDGAPALTLPVFKRTREDDEVIRQALLKSYAFASLSEREFDELCQAFEDCLFKKEDTITTQPGEYFFVIKSGKVDCFVEGNIASQASDGDSFGELDLCESASNVPSKQLATTSSYVAATDVSLFRVDQRTIRLIIKSQQTKSDNDRLKLLQGVKFLNELCESDLKKLASVMAPFAFGKDQLIVERGAASENTFYIIQEGTVICKDVIAGDTQYENNVLGPGEWFSDGSLIPHESRHMNVIAQSRGRLFSIDRTTFDSVLGKFKDLVLKAQDSRRLSGMKCLKNAKLNGRQLASLASVIVEKKYMQMQLIVAQALKTKIAIYIVRKGEVEISRRGKTEIVKAGGYFGGELFNDDGTFDASVYCKPHFSAKALSSVICGILTLQDARTVFDTALLADQSVLSESFNMSFARIDTDADLDDLIKHTILGEGTFGQVWLVSEPLPEMQEDRPYALKIQSKCELAREGHIKAVMEEKRILAQIQHPFTCKLVKAFQDSVFVYLLMELVQGGELFSLLHSDEHHDMGFPEEQAKFYAFCLSDVFAYIHRNKLVFRDLKPENVMIDHKGYPILIDFGFAKYVPDKTYTLCGTPAYLPPECITARGHDCSADHWSLGIFIHEMVDGTNPFYFEGMEQTALFHSIVKDPVKKPTGCSKEAADLVMKLLVKDPTRRLGSLARGEREIKEHPWFNGLDMHELRHRRVPAPWVPQLKDAFDTSCFEDWSHLPDITTQEFDEITEAEKAMFRGFEEAWDE